MQEQDLDVPESKTLKYLGIAFVSIALSFFILKGLDVATTRSQPKNVAPPKVQERFVARPEFETADGKFAAGTAFGLQLEGEKRRIVMTAIHLFGPDGGMPKQIPPEELGKYVKRVALKDAFADGASLGSAETFVPLLLAAPTGTASEAGDVAAFVAGDANLQTAPLAAKNPQPGEFIWLVASVLKGAPATQMLHRAKVEGVTEGDLIYWFDNPQLELRATSGAPLLNSLGEVVGINLGGGTDKGRLSGFGNPVERFRPHLESALKSLAPPVETPKKPVTRPVKPPDSPPST